MKSAAAIFQTAVGLLLAVLGLLTGCGPRKGPFEKKGSGWEFKGVPLAGVSDPATFTPLDDYFAKDAKHAYFCTTERESRELFLVKRARAVALPGADPASFRVLRNRYARDERRAYYEAEMFEVRDLATLEVLEGSFARDRVTGYFMRLPVPESDGPSFAVIGDLYARDRSHVFYGGMSPPPGGGRIQFVCPIVPGADPATFKTLESGYAVDARRAFHQGRLLTEKTAGFESLSLGYAKSATEVFYDGRAIPGADAASFALVMPPAEDADAKSTLR